MNATLTSPELTRADRCDRCGAAARVRAKLPSGAELLFCQHHANEHESKLIELADELGWSVDRLGDVLRAERPADSLDGVDLVSYDESGDEFERVVERLATSQLQPLLLRLSEREREILRARSRGESLRTVGRRLGVSGERVRTIEERALARLRVAADLGVDISPRLLTQVGDHREDKEVD